MQRINRPVHQCSIYCHLELAQYLMNDNLMHIFNFCICLCCAELELERAESFLKQRMDRKRDYRAKTLEITEKRRRKWLV